MDYLVRQIQDGKAEFNEVIVKNVQYVELMHNFSLNFHKQNGDIVSFGIEYVWDFRIIHGGA